MKKIALMFVAMVVIMGWIACQQKTETQQNTNESSMFGSDDDDEIDTTAVNDTIEQEDTVDSAALEKQRIADSIAWWTYTSNDLKFFEVKGHVKTVKLDYRTYSFNIDGELEKVDGKDPYQEPKWDKDSDYMLKKKDGKIVEEYAWEYSAKFIWKGGKVVRCEWTAESFRGKQSYNYGDDDRLISQDCEEKEIDEPATKFLQTFTYKKFDDHGNWLQRTSRSNTSTESFSRKITYYEPKDTIAANKEKAEKEAKAAKEAEKKEAKKVEKNDNKKSSTTEKKSSTTEKKSAATEKKSVTTDTKTSTTDKKSTKTAKKSSTSDKKSTSKNTTKSTSKK